MPRPSVSGEPLAGGGVRLRMKLRWRDMDTLGHLTHSVYHDFLAEARVAAVVDAGPGELERFVLARTEVNHRHEVRQSDGFVDVHARITAVSRRSVTIEHEVLLADGEVALDGSSVLVGWDPERRSSREFDEAERAGLLSRVAGPPATGDADGSAE
jgi:acyl-CoA thioester hydrolase